jgi:hypothetical protein
MDSIKKTLMVSSDGHELYPQSIYGENEHIEDIFSVLNVKPELFDNRPSFKAGDIFQVLLVYPTEKDEKIKPLRDWAKPQISSYLISNGIQADFSEKRFNVEDTGVGEQPYYTNKNPKGLRGAWNRIKYCQSSLFPSIEQQQYHAIFILSAESDLVKEGIHYDAPNVIAFECFTGFTLAGRGRGPAAQENLLAIAEEAGFEDKEELCGNKTYGKVLNEKFGLKSSDWHGAVCGVSRSSLLEEFLKSLEEKWEKELNAKNFIPASSSPSLRRM